MKRYLRQQHTAISTVLVAVLAAGCDGGSKPSAGASGGAPGVDGGDSTSVGGGDMGGATSVGGTATAGGTSTTGSLASVGGATSGTGGIGTTGVVLVTGGAATVGGTRSVSDITGSSGGGVNVGGVAGTGGTGDSPSCTVYVRPDGSDSSSGDHWGEAFATVQKGIDVAASRVSSGSCSAGEVWVAAGTYYPTLDWSGSSKSSDPRNKTIRLRASVALHGGFVGTESMREQSDFAAHPTVLSGDIGYLGNNADNAYHVVTGATGASMDGFTVTLGNANGMTPNGEGAGMYNVSASPTVTHCTFSYNSATGGDGSGGGMCNDSSSPIVTDCKFTQNTASYEGAGMYNKNAASAVVSNCTFTENSSWYGAALTNDENTSVTVSHCKFDHNSATHYGGGIHDMSASLIVTDCTFSSNSAGRGGGAILTNAHSTSMTNCTFNGNTTSQGGAIYTVNTNLSVANCVFSNNEASDGGGIYITSGPLSVMNSTFFRNQGSGIYSYNDYSSPTVANCIFWGNLRGTNVSSIGNEDSIPAVTYSDVEGGCTVDSECTTSDLGNLDEDPLFVDAGNGNLRLQPGSPCIDAANSGVAPATDIIGESRVDVAGIGDSGTSYADMGAYEYQP